MIINVTLNRIGDLAIRRSGDRCPIAKALEEQLGLESVSVDAEGAVFFSEDDSIYEHEVLFQLPIEAIKFIKDYDEGLMVFPLASLSRSPSMNLKALRREKKKLAAKRRLKRHGGGLAQVYANAVLKRIKEKSSC